ncbi:MAG: acetyl-CoA carboxylase biotin carboxyl carrier protein subunit [Vicinamibacterales bacterium]
MQLDIEIGETTRTVVVTREDGRYVVSVDGRARVVDARAVGPATWSLLTGTDATDATGTATDGTDGTAGTLGTPGTSGTSESPAVRRVEASVVPLREPGRFDVYVNGRTVPVLVRTAGMGRRGRDHGGAHGSGPQRVTAPMPGKVVRVLVAPGDEVTAKQGLVVVEAMKMENELKAARDGRVREVAVTEGQSVEAGAVLVVVE